jgi:hypothetical protein
MKLKLNFLMILVFGALAILSFKQHQITKLDTKSKLQADRILLASGDGGV